MISSAVLKLSSVIEKDTDTPIILPLLPKLDDVDGMLTTLGSYLRRIPSDDRLEVYSNMMGILSRKLKECKGT